METERLGIIIVHFGETLRTVKCLGSFISAASKLKKNRNVKISIIIGDNSGNFRLENTRYSCCEVKHLDFGKNLGYAGACYEAAKLLDDCSKLLFSNNDVILNENSLFNLLETMQSLRNVGAIQPLVLAQGLAKVDSMGLTSNTLMHGYNYSNWPIKPIEKRILDGRLKVLETFGIDGMLFMINARVWKEVNGWDPEFFLFNEDSLLSWKLKLRGYSNYVALDSVIYHERGGIAEGYFVKKNPRFSSYYTSRNKILSVLYIYDSIWLVIYFFGCIIFEFSKNFLLSLRNKSALNLYYYFKALIFILSRHNHIILERSKVSRKFKARYYIKQGSILTFWSSMRLMLKRRNNFSE